MPHPLLSCDFFRLAWLKKGVTVVMNWNQFWEILQAASAQEGAKDEQDAFAALTQELVLLSPEEILRFFQFFDDRIGAADTIDLWGAAYLINGGCSDDCFHYFRCWLIGRGRAVYENALRDPDSLADALHGESPCESSLNVAASRAWQQKTGRSEEEFYAELTKLNASAVGLNSKETVEGEDWDFEDEDEVQRRLPRLCALYGEAE